MEDYKVVVTLFFHNSDCFSSEILEKKNIRSMRYYLTIVQTMYKLKLSCINFLMDKKKIIAI